MITSKDFINHSFITQSDTSIKFVERERDAGRYPELDNSKLLKPKANDLEKLDLALLYLQQNPEAARVVEQTIKNKVGIVLIQSEEEVSSYRSLRQNNPDGVIFWNPNQALSLSDTINGKKVSLGQQSAANILLHEMIHATDPNYAKSNPEIANYLKPYDTKNPKFQYQDAAEYRAVTEANRLVSRFYNEPIRPNYNPSIAGFPNVSSVIDFQTNQYDKQGNLIGKLVQQYDSFAQTITRTHTDYEHLDRYGNPTVKQTVTDINGKPVKAVPEKHSFNYENTDWNSLTGSDLYQAVLSADSKQLDMLGKSIAQSEEGQKMTRLGDRLWEDFKEQQELERLQELAQSSRAMLRTL